MLIILISLIHIDFYFFEVMQADLLECVWTEHYVLLNTMNRKSFKLWQKHKIFTKQTIPSKYSSKYLQKLQIEVLSMYMYCKVFYASIMNLCLKNLFFSLILLMCILILCTWMYARVLWYGNCEICNLKEKEKISEGGGGVVDEFIKQYSVYTSFLPWNIYMEYNSR